MRAVLVLLAVAAASFVPAEAQLDLLSNWFSGGYLPPDNDVAGGSTCQNAIQTTTVFNTRTEQVVQPITIDRGQTAIAQAVVTEVQAITTTMVQTETRQVEIPVTRTYEQVVQAQQTQIAEVPYQPEPVVNQVTETKVVASTQVNENVQTSITQVVQPVDVTSTQVQTIVSTAFQTQTQQEVVAVTSTFAPEPVVSYAVETRQDVRTEVAQQPDITSVIDTVVTETSNIVRYVTPLPVVNTQIITETKVDTQFQQVVQTQQTVVTQENTRTEVVQVTDNRIDYITSTAFRDSVITQTSTQVVDRQQFETSFVQQVVTSTQVVDNVDQRIVTSTAYVQVTDYQTITGAADIREEVVTITQNLPQVVTQTVNNAVLMTVNQVVTAPCQQTQTGYNYNRPTNPLVLG